MAVVPWVYNNPRLEGSVRQARRSFLFSGHVVEVLQDVDADIDAAHNTALKLWDGAYFLARYLEHVNFSQPGHWADRRCVELGAGCGLTGLVAWLLGCDITLTDLSSATAHTQRCVTTNIDRILSSGDSIGLESSRIRVMPYSWGDETKDLDPPYDVIIGSDVVYDPVGAAQFVDALRRLGGPLTEIFVSYKRRGLGEECFFSLIEEDFVCEDASVDFRPADFLGSDYRILRLTRVLRGLANME